MTYQVPGGWVETYKQDMGYRKRIVFHEKTDCPKIRVPQLHQVERPGAAARCPLCSPEG